LPDIDCSLAQSQRSGGSAVLGTRRYRVALLGIATAFLLCAAAAGPAAVAASSARPPAIPAVTRASREPSPQQVPGPASESGGARPATPGSPAIVGDDATLSGVSCTAVNSCAAVGFYYAAAEGGFWFGLSEVWNGQQWLTPIVPSQAPKDDVTFAGEVSCTTSTTCMLVGQHYTSSRQPAMMAESYGAVTWNITQWSNPPGARLGWLGDVSCSGSTFCMAVGGDSRTTFSAQRAFSERWTGSHWKRLTMPTPARSRWSELGGVSCVTDAECVAVGDYQSAAKRTLTFAEAWNGHSWTVMKTPDVAGERDSVFNDDSCPTPTTCVAVGYASGPGNRQFAAKWSGGHWKLISVPHVSHSVLAGISCPTASFCMVAGFVGNVAGFAASRALAETWTAGTWKVLRTAHLAGTRSAAELQHVSCVSVTHCVAVGFRDTPKVHFSNHSLAEVWNGHSWKTQMTYNPT
jgi:hypothetical protein